MQRLKAFVMVKFVRDQMVNPHETSVRVELIIIEFILGKLFVNKCFSKVVWLL